MNEATPAYLEPLKAEMVRVESEITELENQLATLRATRTGLGRALGALDPQWAANSNKSKSKSKKPHGASQSRLDEIAQWLRKNKASETFTNTDLSNHTGIHPTTVARVTQELHRDGVIRLDHMGGARKTEKNFRLVTADDA